MCSWIIPLVLLLEVNKVHKMHAFPQLARKLKFSFVLYTVVIMILLISFGFVVLKKLKCRKPRGEEILPLLTDFRQSVYDYEMAEITL